MAIRALTGKKLRYRLVFLLVPKRGFAGKTVIVEPDTGWQVVFFSDGTDATGRATASKDNYGYGRQIKSGDISGGMDGGRFNVVVDYDDGGHQYCRGGVRGNNGVATGVTSNGTRDESGIQFNSRLTCLETA
jgi:hypothetical protein